jgi:hypothetical protein
MSDHEFENYLTLISRFLRLNPAQREAIGEELRDHFESRLAELIDAGKSRHEAVRLALAEFGDAVGLAAEFTHISIARRRRLVMRCTVASVAALAAAVLVAMAVWPENRAGQGARNALAENAVKAPEKPGAAAIPTEDSLTAATEAKLERFMSVDVADQPLSEYFTTLSDFLNMPVFLDTAALRDATIDPATTPVGLALKDIRLRTLLNLMLGQHNLGYTVRDGILIVSTKEKLSNELVTRVYDCRNILNADPKSGVNEKRDSSNGSVRQSAFENQESPSGDSRSIFHLIQASPSTTTPTKRPRGSTPSEKLIDVICTTIAPPSWDEVGGQGSICEYNGLLVVSQTAEIQAQVATLLDQIAGKLAATKK